MRAAAGESAVMRCGELPDRALARVLDRYALTLVRVDDGAAIPGSFWLPPEAGLIANRLYLRNDTPVHSALHESSHYICMDGERRKTLHTDAGGRTAIEEDSVCYLQIILADHVEGFDRQRMWRDMDDWGYSFRLGSAKAWFEQDAEDAAAWLRDHGLIDAFNRPTWCLRA